MIKVHIAAELELVRSGFVSVINSFDDLVVSGQSSCDSELLQSLENRDSDVFIISGEIIRSDEIDFFQFFSEFPFSFKTILVSSAHNLISMKHFMEYCTCGFLEVNDSERYIQDAINNVAQGRVFIPDHLISWFNKTELENNSSEDVHEVVDVEKLLSNQELEVLRLMCENYDYTSGVIGEKLGGKTASQIRTVILRIKNKFQINSKKSKIAIVKYAKDRNIFEH